MPSNSPGSRAVLLDRGTPPHVLTLVAMTAVSALNMNMMLPSLPSLAAYFDIQYSVATLSMSAYQGLTPILQLLIGPLSDR
jgi:DHA1 family bicyclomycin/chloramphenicol resistance-like MFS transporter